MTRKTIQHAIGRFESRQEAEAALIHLRDSGFDMDRVSVIAKDEKIEHISGVETKDVSSSQVQQGAEAGAKGGGIAGGFLGLLGGLGILAIPGVGPVAELGVVLANSLLGSGVGAAGGSLVGALIGWGIPEDQARYYEDRLNEGEYLILVEEEESTMRQAESALSHRALYDWNVYNVAGATTSPVRTGVL